MTTSYSAPAPVTNRVQAFFAPVNRATSTPVLFDVAGQLNFNPAAPPAPWVNLGWIQNFARKAASKTAAVLTGIPAAPLEQTRETLSAELSFEFLSWTKLTMALATGSQHMNLLAESSGATESADGGTPVNAVTVEAGSTSTFIALAQADASTFTPGQWIAVDSDYSGQTGFVGSPVSGAYVKQALSDVNYIRRVTFNVGLVLQVTTAGLTLAAPLIGGAPAAGLKVQPIVGFVDREGGSFYQEWSALFLQQGAQGESIFYYYPRLQNAMSASEAESLLDAKQKEGLSRVLLKGQYLAMPVTDPLDGERVVCYRSYLPAPNALI